MTKGPLASMTREHYFRTRRLSAACTCGLIALAASRTLLALNGVAADRGAPDQPTVPEATLPTTIVELQPFRQTSSMRIASPGGVPGTATLVNLNPTINAWYLLTVLWQDGSQSSYHLENPRPRSQSVVLDPQFPVGVQLLEGSARHPCKLFGSGPDTPLAEASKSHLPYARSRPGVDHRPSRPRHGRRFAALTCNLSVEMLALALHQPSQLPENRDPLVGFQPSPLRSWVSALGLSGVCSIRHPDPKWPALASSATPAQVSGISHRLSLCTARITRGHRRGRRS
jgi:hypothetical protein